MLRRLIAAASIKENRAFTSKIWNWTLMKIIVWHAQCLLGRIDPTERIEMFYTSCKPDKKLLPSMITLPLPDPI